ncbi:MAG: SEL1-like repeat protein [Planctomycetota bacterium]
MKKLIAMIRLLFSCSTRPAESPSEDSTSRLAKQGDMMAQYNLAFMHETGRGGPRNDSEAKKWYQKAADQGHMGAKQKLKNLQKTNPA